MARQVLITGAEGFVGGRLATSLAARGDAVATAFVDLRDAAAVRAHVAAFAPDVVVHLAAISHPQACEADPELAVRVNLGGTATLLEAMRRGAPAARLVFASTAQVYRAPGAEPIEIDEAREIAPQNLYARTKWQAELLIADACARGELRATVLRLFNHTHKSQGAGFFLGHVYSALLTGAREVPVGNLDVDRDFGAVQDLVAAFGAVLPRDARHEVFNVCSGRGYRLRALAEEMARALGSRARFVVDPSRVRPGEPPSIRGSHATLTAATGWAPAATSEAALIAAFLGD